MRLFSTSNRFWWFSTFFYMEDSSKFNEKRDIACLFIFTLCSWLTLFSFLFSFSCTTVKKRRILIKKKVSEVKGGKFSISWRVFRFFSYLLMKALLLCFPCDEEKFLFSLCLKVKFSPPSLSLSLLILYLSTKWRWISKD